MRLIDGDALIEFIENRYDFTWWNDDYEGGIKDACTGILEKISKMPTIETEQKTGIPKDAIEYILRKETVSTNPDNFMANEKFIKFMDDSEIASFGRWQHANGFNTALVAVECALDKIPDSEPERKKGKWIPQDHNKTTGCATTLVYYYPKCSECGHTGDFSMNFCPNCGADMRG